MAGSAAQRGRAAKAVSRRPVVAAVRLVTNHGGLGVRLNSPVSTERGDGRNGPYTTVRSGRCRSSALCTTPRPLAMLSSSLPGAGAVTFAEHEPGGVDAIRGPVGWHRVGGLLTTAGAGCVSCAGQADWHWLPRAKRRHWIRPRLRLCFRPCGRWAARWLAHDASPKAIALAINAS
jgi:hypothetical protein